MSCLCSSVMSLPRLCCTWQRGCVCVVVSHALAVQIVLSHLFNCGSVTAACCTEGTPTFSQVWNPASRSQTRSMCGVLENLMQVYLQPEDKNLQVPRNLLQLFAGASCMLLCIHSSPACS